MERKNYYALDIAKFISALLVIGIHTGPLLDINVEANFVLVQIISRIAVPFFFITSSFLFYQKIDLKREWNDYENIALLKHYIGRICKIYIIWTILYLPFTYWMMHVGDGINMVTLLRYVRDFFFTGSFYHLWFLPALIFSIVASYALLCKFKMKRAIWISLILYAIGMMGNIYPKLLSDIPVIDMLWDMYANIFVTTRNGLFFGMIFMTMGAYFANKSMYLKRPVIFIGFVISLILLFVECYLIRDAGFMSDLTSMYCMLIPSVGFLFLFLIRLKLKKRKVYRTLRQMSLLVYVSHIMFVSVLLWTMPQLNSLIVYFVALVSSLIISYSIVWLSRRIRFLKALY